MKKTNYCIDKENDVRFRKKHYTFSALVSKLKKELVKVVLDVNNYLETIKKYKKDRDPSHFYYDFKLGLDFSIDVGNPESIKNKIYHDKKYYYHAHHFLKIGPYKRSTIPIFWVDISDLSNEMIDEIKKLEPYDRNHLLKQAVSRIFEDINFDLFHDSISSNLKVRIQI